MLMEQHYSAQDDVTHIRHLIRTLEDPRYIRIEGKPLVLLYRIELLPEPQQTAERWRSEVRKAGLGDLFLVNVESNYVRTPRDFTGIGFNAALRFEPSGYSFHYSKFMRGLHSLQRFWRTDAIHPYGDLYRFWKSSCSPPYRRFDCVTPMWDNSARRDRGAFILRDSTPEQYEIWLREAVRRAQPDNEGHRWVFINAWNEWAEGCHLEPCQKWGRAYLEATRRVYDNYPATGFHSG
jgi:hypothetical protein